MGAELKVKSDRFVAVLPAATKPHSISVDLPPPIPSKNTGHDSAPSGSLDNPQPPASPMSKLNDAIIRRIPAEKKDLLEIIAEAKANGSGQLLEIVRGVAMPDGAGSAAMRILAQQDENRPYSSFTGNSPAEIVRLYGSALAKADSRIIDPEKRHTVPIPVFGMLVSYPSPTDPDRVQVQVHDYLAPGPSLVLNKQIDLTDKAQCRSVIDVLNETFSKNYRGGVYKKAVEDATPAPDFKPALSIHQTELNPPNSFDKIKADFPRLNFDVLPRGAVDEKSFEDIRIPTELVRKGIAVNGEIRRIGGIREITLRNGEFTLDPEGRLQTVEGQPATTQFSDKYGNMVLRQFSSSRHPEAGDTVLQLLEIAPPLNFPIDGERMRTLKVDLSQFGYGDNLNLATCRTLDPVSRVGKISVYTDTDADRIKHDHGRQLAKFVEGIKETEKLFRLKSGKDITTIAVLDSESANASYSNLNPNSIKILDEILPSKGMLEIGRHESLHLVDGKYDNKPSAALEPLYQKLQAENPGFFAKVNENSFIPGVPQGGHSADNTKEMFASLLNSAISRTCEEQLGKQDQQFRSAFAEGLKLVRDCLRSLPDFPQNAPIFGLLDRRLKSPYLSDPSLATR